MIPFRPGVRALHVLLAAVAFDLYILTMCFTSLVLGQAALLHAGYEGRDLIIS